MNTYLSEYSRAPPSVGAVLDLEVPPQLGGIPLPLLLHGVVGGGGHLSNFPGLGQQAATHKHGAAMSRRRRLLKEKERRMEYVNDGQRRNPPLPHHPLSIHSVDRRRNNWEFSSGDGGFCWGGRKPSLSNPTRYAAAEQYCTNMMLGKLCTKLSPYKSPARLLRIATLLGAGDCSRGVGDSAELSHSIPLP